MKTNSNIKLRKIGSRFMIVADSDNETSKTHVYELNESAARLWQMMSGKDLSADELTECFCEVFDVAKDVAHADIERQLEEWKRFGLVE